ncbi:hypothetical protein Tco_0749197 [Tanacetum coccineum]|uniref:Uncharacterized protein n=1 Tax=Tanacetum coccineum TaxID=301880 RepID=A0ABQ4YYR0_9ASTR
MESVKKSIDERAKHKEEYNSWVNERQMQTTEDKVDSSKALDASLVDTESSGTKALEQQDTRTDQGIMNILMMQISDPYMMKSQWLRYKQLLKSISLLLDNSILSNLNSIMKEGDPGFKEFCSDEQTMMSDHNSSDLAPQRQETSVANNTPGTRSLK